MEKGWRLVARFIDPRCDKICVATSGGKESWKAAIADALSFKAEVRHMIGVGPDHPVSVMAERVGGDP